MNLIPVSFTNDKNAKSESGHSFNVGESFVECQATFLTLDSFFDLSENATPWNFRSIRCPIEFRNLREIMIAHHEEFPKLADTKISEYLDLVNS